jgi:hypothetical protein
MARYFTREAVRESVEILNVDRAHLEAAKLLTGKIALRVFDAPDGKDLIVTYVFEKGRCTDWVYEEETAPSKLRTRAFKPMKDGIARVTAKYQTFVKLDKGEMAPADAVRSPDYAIEGSMLMIMPLMQAITSWNETVRRIKKEY